MLGALCAAAHDCLVVAGQAGACFGLSAAACRTGFLLGQHSGVAWVALGLAASVAATSAGFVLQTCGLKDGNTVVVCTCAAVSSMVTGQQAAGSGTIQAGIEAV